MVAAGNCSESIAEEMSVMLTQYPLRAHQLAGDLVNPEDWHMQSICGLLELVAREFSRGWSP